MVQDVEELAPKLQAETIRQLEVLEQRKIQPADGGTRNLRCRSAEQRVPSQAGNANGGLRKGRRRARLSKGGRVQEMVRRSRTVPVLSRNGEVVAANAGRWIVVAGKRNRLSALDGGDPLRAPAAYELVCDAGDAGKVVFPLAKRKFVCAAEVEDLPNVEVAVAVISLNPRTWHIHGSVRSDGRTVEKVSRIASAA